MLPCNHLSVSTLKFHLKISCKNFPQQRAGSSPSLWLKGSSGALHNSHSGCLTKAKILLETFPCLGIFASFDRDSLRLSLSWAPVSHGMYPQDEIGIPPDSVAISQGGCCLDLISICCTPDYSINYTCHQIWSVDLTQACSQSFH
jgi:hypothetical protein